MIAPKSANPTMKPIALVTAKVWFRKRSSGRIGSAARASARMKAGTRTMLAMRFYDDMSEQQIAAILDCPVGTVKSTLSRGLAKLREMDALRSYAGDSQGGAS